MRLVEGYGALLLEKPVKTLAVADLHLGFEEELRSKGVRVPLQSIKIVEELVSVIKSTGAKRLVVVGDLKHNVQGPSRLEYEVLPRFVKPVKRLVEELIILPGNHDGKIEKVLTGHATLCRADGFVVEEESVGFTHGHVKPSIHVASMDFIVTGHLHPVLKIGRGGSSVRMGVWLKIRGDRRKLFTKLFKTDAPQASSEVSLIIMPSFNKIMQGRSVTELSQSSLTRGPLLRSGAFHLEEAEVIGLDGAFLGTLADLRRLVS
ncbi:MAG: metallophosphoesterase family protein [Aigarchaeota archaeon]|nr:metallophosphoesterase family protein [Candidatus Caldarchaeales archaeon]MDJ0273395.1 metallophosphoesterase family protein [Candidatus Caldarchaeales archaeon]